MKIYYKDYYSLTSHELSVFYDFLKSTEKEPEQPAQVNMWNDDWKSHSSTLPYLLEFTDRFLKDGKFFIYYNDETIIGCSGIYISDFSRDFAIAGVRTWILKPYRHLSINRDVFLVDQKKWAMDRNLKAIGLTFNQYNKNIIKIFKRRRLGEKIDRINTREPKHLFYNGIEEVQFPVTIQYTPQYVIYEKLEDWNYEWTELEYK